MPSHFCDGDDLFEGKHGIIGQYEFVFFFCGGILIMIPNNIYVILGVPCAGKTTISNILCRKYGMHYFSGDKVHFSYYKRANPIDHPAMSRNMSDYFDLPADYLIQRERDIFKEQTPMIVSDLTKISCTYDKVLFDGIMDLEYISSIIDKNRIVYLNVSRAIRERDFFYREDHIHMLDSIRNNADFSEEEKERRITLRRTVAIDSYDYDAPKYGIAQFTRDDNTTTGEILAFVEKHFGLTL